MYTEKSQNDYINIELPYKLNILWSHIHWSYFDWSLDKDKYNVLNKGLINCALLETSILFGRLLLELIGVKQTKGAFVRVNKKYKDDILINDIFPEIGLCSIDEILLLDHNDEILYLLNISNKRVAHNTFNEIEKTEIERIHKAQMAIHDLIQKMLPDIPEGSLLRYNDLANMTT